MHKSRLNLLLFFILFGITFTHAQTFQWAKRIGAASGTQNIRSSITDATGNIYITGYFTGTVDFDPSAATYNLISGGSQDVFICKLSALGNFIWAKSFGGSQSDWTYDIAVDATGNVYTVGVFQGTVDFDPGAAILNITTNGGTDGFISKLSNAGNLVWVRRFGSTSVDNCQSVAIDAANNIYISGSSGGTFDADPGPPVYPVGSGSFLLKLNNLGNFIWVRQLGGSDPKIAVDATNNVYITGEFSGTVDFDPIGTSNLTSAGGNDVFVSKLTTAGVFVWAKRIGGIGNEISDDLAVDATGNVHTIGLFDDVCDFDPGVGVFNITSIAGGIGADMFISKINSAGNFVWAKSVLSPNGVYVASIDLDATGNVYTTGNYSGTVDFNPGAAVNNLVAPSGNEAYLLKLSPVGNYVWAYDIGATTAVSGQSITIDAIGGIITSGSFTGTGDFNPYPAVFNLTSNGNFNMFVLKLYVSPLPVELLSFNATQNKNTVDITWQTSSETNNDYFTIEKSKDGNAFEEIGKVNGAGNSNTVLNYSFEDENSNTGISYYRLKQTDFNGTFSYSQIVAVRITDVNYNVLAYPNPFHDKLTITISTKENLFCLIILRDLMGRTLLSNAVETEQGFNSYEIDAPLLSSGVYLLEVKTPENHWVTKVVLE